MNIFSKSTTQILRLILVLVFSTGFSSGQAQPSETSPELILRVKPSLCLRYASGEECTLEVEVIWRDSVANSYCLHSIQDQEPVQCWENMEGATLEEERSMQEDLVYWLSRPGEAVQLVTAKVEMATVVDDEKRSRSRRRHIWNLI